LHLAGTPAAASSWERIPGGSEITVKLDDGTEVGGILKGIEGEQVLFEGSDKVITFDHVEMALMEIGSEGPE
jgi:hypothetical protein